MKSLISVPTPSYSTTREVLVKALPSRIICLLACGGRDCRYEGPDCWRPSQQVIRGLFSNWVTDDIVAMARPSTRLIQRYKIIDQFKTLNIKSIINMQLPGEHTHCGPDLDPNSGFTYSPQIFMENQIYFYNFGLPDFGVSSLEAVLDAVKVLTFSVQEGKVAVHCHAGLGRTGVLIACYLIYTLRISPSEAVHYIRIKRPRSIQTRAQIELVFDFARFLGFILAQFPCPSLRHDHGFSLSQYLHRQTLILHGKEARRLTNIPKILHLLCSLLVNLCQEPGSSRCADVQDELRRKTRILDLRRAVRDTLVLRRYLPVLTKEDEEEEEEEDSSWDETFGFLQRRGNVLLNKRSFSDSDLHKVSSDEDTELKHRCSLLQESDKICNGIINDVKDDKSMNSIIKRSNNEGDEFSSNSPSTSHMFKYINKEKVVMIKSQKFLQLSSSTEKFCNKHRTSELFMASTAVAKAMGRQEAPGDKILQRASRLQKELNTSACGWAALTKETNPNVLSSLMWTWLENLKEPLLSTDDVNIIINMPEPNPLQMLSKSQYRTLCCLLDCIARVTSRCPRFTDAVLQRLIQALTKCPAETVDHIALRTVFVAHVKVVRRLLYFCTVTWAEKPPTSPTKPLTGGSV